MESVQSELGQAESRSEFGSLEILFYADGTRLEFVDGKLISTSNPLKSTDSPAANRSPQVDDPLVNAQMIVEQRQEQTISASTSRKGLDYSLLAESHGNRNTLETEFMAEEAVSARAGLSPSRRGLKQVMLASVIEFIVTLLVLLFAFKLCGFSSVLWSGLLLSLAVAIVGALFDTLLQAGPLHPLRIVAGFAILLFAVPLLSQRRRWRTAIKIAVLTRIAFILVAWLGLYGLSGILRI